MSFSKAIRDSVVAQFGLELAAGRHQEYPALRQLWIEAETERAEEMALREACADVTYDSKPRMD